MANNICKCITPRLASDHFGKVTVPVGGLVAGNIVSLDALDATIPYNIEVYTAGVVTATTVNAGQLALVVNGGMVETLADGRTPIGQPDYFQYDYVVGGDPAPVIYIDNHLVFQIGLNAVTSASRNLAVVGNYITGVAGSKELTAAAAIPAATKGALKIVALYNTPLGGNYGAGFEASLICKVVG